MSVIELGPFDLHTPLGEGGMGAVWRGIHRLQRRPVAVKLMTLEAARDPGYRAAFRNEVRAAAALNHPHVVQVFEYGEASAATEASSQGAIHQGTPFLAMALVEGGTLHPMLGALDWERLRTVVLALLDALAHAHARGVIHRDLKPSNVLAGPDPSLAQVQLTDFGLAHPVEGAMAGQERPFYGGTPSYMAPEQFQGRWRDYGPWTDLYAFGCLIYALVHGSPPFGPTLPYNEKMRQHLNDPVPPLLPRFAVPAALETWLLKLLAKDPGQRFRRAADAAWAFRALGGPDTVHLATGPAAQEPDETLLLHPRPPQPSQGDATTVELPPALASGASFSLGVAGSATPPLLGDWRRPEGCARQGPLAGAGLGLFGLRNPPLVGREAERDALWRTLGAVRHESRARLVLLGGPVGSGKSRIAEWLCERAHEVGAATILRVNHEPVPGAGHGLGPMVAQTLRCRGLSRDEVLKRVEQIFRSHGVDHADEWLALTEVITPSSRHQAGAIRFDSPMERYVTIRRLLQTLCIERPVIVWMDDVQWGMDTLRFVSYLLDRQRQQPLPLLLLATVADELVAERRDEAALLAELGQRPEAERIEVGPLPSGPFRELVEEQLGLDSHLAARIERRSAGNPMFAVHLIEDWIQEDLLEPGATGFRLRAEVELPDDMAALWRARVDHLLALRDPAEVRALNLAATLGMDIDPREWHAACARSSAGPSGQAPAPAHPTDALLEALLSQRLAKTGAAGPSRGWSFAHAMLRESLLERAAADGELAGLHALCAETLAARIAQNEGQVPAALTERLGRHLLAAGRGEEALGPLLDAAQGRHDLGDFAAASQILDLRDQALQSLNLPPADIRWGESWLVRHSVAQGRGDYEETDAWLLKVERAASRYGWAPLAATARCYRGRQARLEGDLTRALAAQSDVDKLATVLNDRALRARARWEIGTALSDHGDLSQGERYVRLALSDYEAIADPVGMARAWQSLGEITKEAGRHREAAVLLQQAEALFEECGSRWGMASAINSQGDVARYLGKLDEAEALYLRARGLFRAIGSGAWSFPDYNLGLLDLARGHSQRARRPLESGMHTFVRQGNRAAIACAHLALAACGALDDRWLEWDDHLQQAQDLIGQSALVVEDAARTAALAGQLAASAGERARALLAWRIARAQWVGLGRTTDIAAADETLDALEHPSHR